MSIIFSGIKIPPDHGEKQAFEHAVRVCRLSEQQIKHLAVHKLSIDARRGSVEKVYAVRIDLFDKDMERRLADSISYVSLLQETRLVIKKGSSRLLQRPVVIGFGPAGMFAALFLAQYGFCPLVLERGGDMDSRIAAVERFFSGGCLSTATNIQFGEGGAGTFSDGKLTTRINDPLCDTVIKKLLRFGAPRDIEYKAKPHLGTDNLRTVVKNIRAEIERLGGEVRFYSRAEGFDIKNGQLKGIVANGEYIPTRTAVLAVGHSARDTFRLLDSLDIALAAKPFSVGARIEHLQSEIDLSMYRSAAGHPKLPSAEYNCSAVVDGRAVYTFCMCPGGTVVAASSQEGGVVTNGMSGYKRDGKNANSAVVVAVDERDFGYDPFSAIAYQENIERRAFEAAGSCYKAPAADVASFLQRRAALEPKAVVPTYPRGVVAADFADILGASVTDAMRAGIIEFGKRISCFAKDGVLTAPETRTSSPVRILRDDARQSVGVAGLYPCGEGAGYAGGIMSAAVDGIKTAVEIIGKFYFI